MWHLILQDDGGFWIDGNEPSEPHIKFVEWDDAFKAGMAHRSKYESNKEA